MSVSQTVSVSESVSVSVVSIGLRLSLSLPLVQPSDVLGRVSAGVELADSISGSEVPQTVDVVKTKTNSVSVSVSVERISLGTPLTKVVSTASVAGGLDSITKGSRPGRRDTTRAHKGIAMDKGGVSLRGGQGGNSQAGGNQEFLHIVDRHTLPAGVQSCSVPM